MSLGRKAEHFAEPTQRECDLEGAVKALPADCNVGLPSSLTFDSPDAKETLDGPPC
ncbi:MAG: hypothetical protein JWQ11_1770 [Rhizobacter sp.]|nr:hypothetical protein [Rhizobacter sp.]